MVITCSVNGQAEKVIQEQVEVGQVSQVKVQTGEFTHHNVAVCVCSTPCIMMAYFISVCCILHSAACPQLVLFIVCYSCVIARYTGAKQRKLLNIYS